MLEQLIGPVAGLLDKFIEDKDTKNALAHEISTRMETGCRLGVRVGYGLKLCTYPHSKFYLSPRWLRNNCPVNRHLYHDARTAWYVRSRCHAECRED